jgi:GAF domain-containing protein
VTQGDLTRSITVEALGEVAALKDTINEMIRNLQDTTQVNTEQDWLKTNLAKFSRMLQGQKDLVAVGHLILSELAPVVGAQQAEFYVLRYTHEQPRLRLMASYASDGHGSYGKEIDLGQGLVGQCAYDKRKILLTSSIPDSLRISSGLTELAPLSVLVLPIIFEGQVRGVASSPSSGSIRPTRRSWTS